MSAHNFKIIRLRVSAREGEGDIVHLLLLFGNEKDAVFEFGNAPGSS